jgi:hypothetical protein
MPHSCPVTSHPSTSRAPRAAKLLGLRRLERRLHHFVTTAVIEEAPLAFAGGVGSPRRARPMTVDALHPERCRSQDTSNTPALAAHAAPHHPERPDGRPRRNAVVGGRGQRRVADRARRGVACSVDQGNEPFDCDRFLQQRVSSYWHEGPRRLQARSSTHCGFQRISGVEAPRSADPLSRLHAPTRTPDCSHSRSGRAIMKV